MKKNINIRCLGFVGFRVFAHLANEYCLSLDKNKIPFKKIETLILLAAGGKVKSNQNIEGELIEEF